MATANQEHQSQLRQLAELILAVAGESVTVMKRSAPERALKLKRQDEWGIYLEFLKVMFNLTDRLSVLFLPIKEQPQFMDSLEDAVTLQLKNVLEPAFGSGADQTEIMLTVGAAVAESRQTYERYRFLVTENTPAGSTPGRRARPGSGSVWWARRRAWWFSCCRVGLSRLVCAVPGKAQHCHPYYTPAASSPLPSGNAKRNPRSSHDRLFERAHWL